MSQYQSLIYVHGTPHDTPHCIIPSLQAISALGMLVYDVLDYGLAEDEERALPQTLEHLIDLMTMEECDTTSDIGSDCDSDSDQILGITRNSSREISLEEIIKVLV